MPSPLGLSVSGSSGTSFAATDALVTASGGVSTLDDIAEIARYADEGIDSVIVGKALYENRFTLPEALRVAGGK